jgi:hypothetical protein
MAEDWYMYKHLLPHVLLVQKSGETQYPFPQDLKATQASDLADEYSLLDQLQY